MLETFDKNVVLDLSYQAFCHDSPTISRLRDEGSYVMNLSQYTSVQVKTFIDKYRSAIPYTEVQDFEAMIDMANLLLLPPIEVFLIAPISAIQSAIKCAIPWGVHSMVYAVINLFYKLHVFHDRKLLQLMVHSTNYPEGKIPYHITQTPTQYHEAYTAYTTVLYVNQSNKMLDNID